MPTRPSTAELAARLQSARLYTFVDTAYLHGRDPGEVARQLCAGGSDLIQVRAKSAPASEVLRLATAVGKVTARAGVLLVVNDHPDVAVQVGADICHLGQEDFFEAGYTSVEALPGRNNRLTPLGYGLSSHAPAEADRAVRSGADYVAIGPVYATGTKPEAKPVTLEYVRWAAEHVTVPWFAIGGINLANLDEVLAAGARRICVVSAILNATDVAGACQAFRQRLPSVPVS